jgi:pimeloyl-ACP methyl ester carboxylesterase
MLRLPSILLAVLLVGLISTGAMSSMPVPEETVGTPEPVGERYDIGGRSLSLTCQGTGGPTVLLEAGLLMGASTWQRVMPDIAGLSRVCAYDRANVGASDPAAGPRRIADAVADLHALVAAAGLEPPFILVGHSFGGLIIRLYAASFPDEIAGLVLVDSTPLGILDPGSACSQVSQQACAVVHAMVGPNPEGIMPAAEETSLMDDTTPGVPVRILVATDHPFPAEVDAELEMLAWRLQQELAVAWPSAALIVAEGSGHLIQLDRPALVVKAVSDVLEATQTR